MHYTNANKLNTVQLTNPVFAFLADCFGPPSQNQNLHQGWYDNQIGVDPKDENIVWTAGIDAMRPDDGGQTWGVASYWWFESGVDPNYAHADNHPQSTAGSANCPATSSSSTLRDGPDQFQSTLVRWRAGVAPQSTAYGHGDSFRGP